MMAIKSGNETSLSDRTDVCSGRLEEKGARCHLMYDSKSRIAKPRGGPGRSPGRTSGSPRLHRSAKTGHAVVRRLKDNMNFIKVNKASGFSLKELIIVMAIIGVLAAIALPAYVSARSRSAKSDCILNLSILSGAQAIYSRENHKLNPDPVTMDDLKPYISLSSSGSRLSCPAGGTYIVNFISNAPSCSIPEHTGGANVSTPTQGL
jgi:prepilin-type N-terminal cleavage/methylation domain-containing protein